MKPYIIVLKYSLHDFTRFTLLNISSSISIFKLSKVSKAFIEVYVWHNTQELAMRAALAQ